MLIGATCTGCAGSCPAAGETEAPEDAEAAPAERSAEDGETGAESLLVAMTETDPRENRVD